MDRPEVLLRREELEGFTSDQLPGNPPGLGGEASRVALSRIVGESSSASDLWYLKGFGMKTWDLKKNYFILFNIGQLLNLIYLTLKCSTTGTWSKHAPEISMKPG